MPTAGKALGDEPGMTIAYIVSSGRSGSTLLDMLLGSHTQCFSLGEIEHLPKNFALDTPCSCGATARSCEFWNEVAAYLAPRTHVDIRLNPYDFPVGLYKASQVIDPRHQTPAYLRKRRAILFIKYLEYRMGREPRWLSWATREFRTGVANTFQLYEAVQTVSGRSLLIDSSKDYRKGIALYIRQPEQVRIVLLTRDGRGVLASKMRSGFPREASVRSWVAFHRRTLPLLRRNVAEGDCFHLRYEDLATQPGDILRNLCQFLRIDYEPRMLEFRDAGHHILNGNDMRMSTVGKISLDDRWRQQLSQEDLAVFERIAGRLNRQLGYS